jgi:hypothetical protein
MLVVEDLTLISFKAKLIPAADLTVGTVPYRRKTRTWIPSQELDWLRQPSGWNPRRSAERPVRRCHQNAASLDATRVQRSLRSSRKQVAQASDGQLSANDSHQPARFPYVLMYRNLETNGVLLHILSVFMAGAENRDGFRATLTII